MHNQTSSLTGTTSSAGLSGTSRASELTLSEAITQFKEATASIYNVIGSIGSASATNAKVRFDAGKERVMELEQKAEKIVMERPLMTLGIAFAAGCLVSRLMQGSHKDS